MADTADSILLLRLQETGGNVNLWGGYLNTALTTAARAMKGYQAYALTGDATLTWANYTATNDGEVQSLKFTGTLTGNASVTMPNNQHSLMAWNGTSGGFSVTVKCSGQTGVTIPNGAITLLFCDGTDFRSGVPTWIGTAADPLVNDGDVVTKATLDDAIAASFTATFGAGGTIKITASDTTPKYLNASITTQVGGLATLTVSTLNPGGNEQAQLAMTTPALSGVYAATITSGTVAMTANGRVRITGGQGTLPTFAATDSLIVEFDPASGTTVTIGRNSQTIDGAAEDDTYIGDGGASPVVMYSYSSAGAVKSEIIGSVP